MFIFLVPNEAFKMPLHSENVQNRKELKRVLLYYGVLWNWFGQIIEKIRIFVIGSSPEVLSSNNGGNQVHLWKKCLS